MGFPAAFGGERSDLKGERPLPLPHPPTIPRIRQSREHLIAFFDEGLEPIDHPPQPDPIVVAEFPMFPSPHRLDQQPAEFRVDPSHPVNPRERARRERLLVHDASSPSFASTSSGSSAGVPSGRGIVSGSGVSMSANVRRRTRVRFGRGGSGRSVTGAGVRVAIGRGIAPPRQVRRQDVGAGAFFATMF